MKRTLVILLLFIAVVVAAVIAKFYLNVSQGNALTIYNVDVAKGLNGKPGVEIEVSSPRAFPITNAMVVLQIGTKVFKVSEFKGGDAHTLVFTLTPEEFASIRDESLVTVRYDPDSEGHWDFGFLEKNWDTGQRR
jgi:hypothetical protein